MYRVELLAALSSVTGRLTLIKICLLHVQTNKGVDFNEITVLRPKRLNLNLPPVTLQTKTCRELVGVALECTWSIAHIEDTLENSEKLHYT